DPDNGQSLAYDITSGNTDNAFNINAATGEITVNNSLALNFEQTAIFSLTVTVTDNGSGSLSNQASVIINLNDINEPPEIVNQSFAIDENSTNGSSVGIVIASDPDNGQSLAYSITSGNADNAFNINVATGEITVNNSSALNFEQTATFWLTVTVTDNGSGSLSNQASVIINLNDINEAPVILTESLQVTIDGALVINEINGIKIPVGNIEAYDPDLGQTLSYEITSGNHPVIWEIEWLSGNVSVINPYAFNPVELHTYKIYIKVADNSAQSLYTEAEIEIDVNIQDVNAYIENIQFYTSTELPISGEANFKMYPNPANEKLRIEANGLQEGQFSIAIFNLSGEEVLKANYGKLSGKLTSDLDVSRLSKGVYMVKFQLGKVSQIEKLIKL
ncbi:MAG: cadherin domain-containing protein, partial [Bacteroidales bacterium]|nr:cadherin domain-containing protein [Bacteroidales bacterium]